MFVAKFESTFRFTSPPDIVVPEFPVNNPSEVIVPVPVAEISPVVLTSSPKFEGLSKFKPSSRVQ